MANERWISPFSKTIAFTLFSKHFTELNDIYWAHVPAANTIESKAKKALTNPDKDPKTFFLIRDEDDRRLAPTLVFKTVKSIDQHLLHNFIGSYDVCKFYYQCVQNGDICGKTAGEQAKELQKIIGSTLNNRMS